MGNRHTAPRHPGGHDDRAKFWASSEIVCFKGYISTLSHDRECRPRENHAARSELGRPVTSFYYLQAPARKMEESALQHNIEQGGSYNRGVTLAMTISLGS